MDSKVNKELDEIKQNEPKSIDNMNEDKTNEKNNSSKMNIDHLCRICLLTRESLLSSLSEAHKDLPDMYFAVTSIKVDMDSHYAFKICEICKNDLTFFYDFKKKCLKSDLIFKTLIGDNKTNEDDGTRSVTTARKIENDGKGMKEDEVIEHEDVQYLDDTLDYDMYDNNDQEISVTITRETENVEDIPESSSDSRCQKISKSRQTYSCTMCPKRFLKAQTLKAHVKSDHWVLRSHSCGNCKKIFSSEHDLKLHLQIHAKSDAWTCAECNKQFNCKKQLKRHIERHMEVKRHACAACGKMFSEQYSLRRHERVHTGEVLHKPFACQLCDKRFRYSALLSAHMAQHGGARPCTCVACGKTFASERLLTSHSLVHRDHKPYKCHYCDKTFRHVSTRNTHHRTHTGERPHVCARCGNTFIQRSNLVRHMRVHTGEKPYTCKVCDRKFGCGSSLKNHMTIHTGEKPYQCKVCDKRFARSNMRMHMAMHTGERPHECAACGKRFVRLWTLREHSRLHTGEKPFECARCNDKFVTKVQLMRHFKIHEKCKKPAKKEVIIKKPKISKPKVSPEKIIFSDDKTETSKNQETYDGNKNLQSDFNTDSKIIIPDEMPLEVTEEVILQDNEDRTELFQNSQTSQYVTNSSDGNVCENLKSNIHYIKMTENGPNISSAILEDGGIKLYQLEQTANSFIIHRLGKELTVRKVTSKKTDF
ncbi:zinc finger protein 2 homolog [Papilio machaon]|uniref:zinc finger protein 2 homolog n=1 Tax=Papilio machaon TaxID=76193 RepID=UPI001E663E29|nr:zinc finger protein 2 homolog [Papilio machaon]